MGVCRSLLHSFSYENMRFAVDFIFFSINPFNPRKTEKLDF